MVRVFSPPCGVNVTEMSNAPTVPGTTRAVDHVGVRDDRRVLDVTIRLAITRRPASRRTGVKLKSRPQGQPTANARLIEAAWRKTRGGEIWVCRANTSRDFRLACAPRLTRTVFSRVWQHAHRRRILIRSHWAQRTGSDARHLQDLPSTCCRTVGCLPLRMRFADPAERVVFARPIIHGA